MPYLVIFRLKFENNYVIFEFSTFEFVKIQNFMLNKIEFQIKIAIFENSTLKFVKIQSFM